MVLGNKQYNTKCVRFLWGYCTRYIVFSRLCTHFVMNYWLLKSQDFKKDKVTYWKWIDHINLIILRFYIFTCTGGVHYWTHQTAALLWSKQKVAISCVGVSWNSRGSSTTHHHRTTHWEWHFYNEAESWFQYYLLWYYVSIHIFWIKCQIFYHN